MIFYNTVMLSKNLRTGDRYPLGTTSPNASGGQLSTCPRQICAIGTVLTS